LPEFVGDPYDPARDRRFPLTRARKWHAHLSLFDFDRPDRASSRQAFRLHVLTEANNLAIRGVAALATTGPGGIMHADAAQAVGKIGVNVDDLGVDPLSIAGHKLYAPKAIGALYSRRGTALSQLLVGAGQEGGRRPGTENVAGIVALGAACELAAGLLSTEPDLLAELRELLWSTLSSFIPGLVRLSPPAGCLPNTLTIAAPGKIGADVLDRAPQLAASTGSACHSGVHTPAATLLAMGITPDTAIGAIRLSLGRATTIQDIRDAAAFLAQAARQGAAS
jgi:cysteine desulfurase